MASLDSLQIKDVISSREIESRKLPGDSENCSYSKSVEKKSIMISIRKEPINNSYSESENNFMNSKSLGEVSNLLDNKYNEKYLNSVSNSKLKEKIDSFYLSQKMNSNQNQSEMNSSKLKEDIKKSKLTLKYKNIESEIINPGENKINVDIQIVLPNNEKINEKFAFDDSILSIKNKIKEIKGFPIESQILYLNSNELLDEDRIEDFEKKYNVFIINELYLILKNSKIKFKTSKKQFNITIFPLTKLEELKDEIYKNTYSLSGLQLISFNKNITLEKQSIEILDLNKDSSTLLAYLKNNEIKKEEIEESLDDLIFKYNEKHRKEHFKQLPLYIFNEENKADYEINCCNQKNPIINNIPIIIIDKNEYNNFIKILIHFQKYSKFKDYNILTEKFIIPNVSIEKINNKNKIGNFLTEKNIIKNEPIEKTNHINKKGNIFFAECKTSQNYYYKKDYQDLESKLKLPFGQDLLEFIEDWVRVVFNIIAEYVFFILKKKASIFLLPKM